jgi:hypothetical protein
MRSIHVTREGRAEVCRRGKLRTHVVKESSGAEETKRGSLCVEN